METLIQAGATGMRVASVDVRVNPKTRDSRLFKSIPQYLRKTGGTMLSMFVLYRPGAFFSLLSAPFFLLAAVLGIRFLVLVYAFPDPARTHLPSLILLAISAFAGFLCILLAVLGSLLAANRRLSEEQLFLARRNITIGPRAGDSTS